MQYGGRVVSRAYDALGECLLRDRESRRYRRKAAERIDNTINVISRDMVQNQIHPWKIQFDSNLTVHRAVFVTWRIDVARAADHGSHTIRDREALHQPLLRINQAI